MRLSKTWLLILTCALAASALGAGAAARRPKLSGLWELDASRSSFGGYDGPLSKARAKLDIKHKEPEVRIIWDYALGDQRLSLWTVFYSDGRGEQHTSLLDAEDDLGETTTSRGGGGPGRQVRSQSSWEGDRLVTRTAERLKVSGTDVPVEVTDEWELSSDGKSLTQTTRVASADAAVRLEFRRVYKRVK